MVLRVQVKRKAFTLVEVLIVVIIIGILSGYLLLVAGSGSDKANATRIVSNLRNLKTAAAMYYADKNEWASNDVFLLNDYLDSNIKSDYKMSDDTYVYYDGDLVNPSNGVNIKLEQMTKNGGVPLFSSDGSSFDAGQTAVYMKIK